MPAGAVTGRFARSSGYMAITSIFTSVCLRYLLILHPGRKNFNSGSW